MSTPIVSGAIALLLEKYPDMIQPGRKAEADGNMPGHGPSKKPAGLGAPGRGTAFEIEHPDAAKEMESQAAFSAAFHKIWAGAASAVPVSFGYSAVVFCGKPQKSRAFPGKVEKGLQISGKHAKIYMDFT